MTAEQVIALGEYRKEGYDPAPLTIAYLKAIFDFHHVKPKQPLRKPEMVKLFKETFKTSADFEMSSAGDFDNAGDFAMLSVAGSDVDELEEEDVPATLTVSIASLFDNQLTDRIGSRQQVRRLPPLRNRIGT